MAGVFISRGMTVAVPPAGLKININENGQTTASMDIHVRFDVCPTWLELAKYHTEDARRLCLVREDAWQGSNEEDKALTLEREFEASMQAIMAAAIAIDAFYALIQNHVQLPSSLITKWRDNRTARFTQVTEVIRRAFHLKPQGTKILKQNLKEIYRLRDLAVHPSGKIEAPVLHPELNVGVEWRFSCFRAYNAELVFNAASWILWDLAQSGKPKDSKLQEYMSTLRLRLNALFLGGHPFATVTQA